jgi:hypothetical protein
MVVMKQMYFIAHRDLAVPMKSLRHASGQSEREDATRVDPSREYEIQVLDDAGRSTRRVYLSASEIGTKNLDNIPQAVVSTVLSIPVGTAKYVDEQGREAAPF